MENTFSTETGSYKGKPTITINKTYESNGEQKNSRVLTFGVAKAKAILSQVEDIKKFVEESESKNSQQVDLNKLTPEQRELVNSFINK